MKPASPFDVSVGPGLTGVADAVVAEILFGEAAPERILGVTRDVAAESALPLDQATFLLHRLVVRDPTFLAVDPAAAVDAQLRLLMLFARVQHASLWLRAGAAREVCAGAVGAAAARRQVRAAARHALAGEGNGAAAMRSLPVRAENDLSAALIFQTRRGKARLGLALAAETAMALGPILERRRLLDDSLRSAGQLLEAVERRIARLGFDLHDGPLQRLSILAGELTLLSRKLPALIPDEDVQAAVEQKVAHLTELAIEVGREVRDLSRSAAIRVRVPLRDELDREARQLRERTGMDVQVSVDGDLGGMTPSQRIVVLRVVEEALTNVREHSGATTVHIALRREPSLIHLTIEDDGNGFDVRRATRRASRNGRLGLVSMTERVRLLGGRLDITSRPGGPTVIIAAVPVWSPAEQGAVGTVNAVG